MNRRQTTGQSNILALGFQTFAKRKEVAASSGFNVAAPAAERGEFCGLVSPSVHVEIPCGERPRDTRVLSDITPQRVNRHQQY